MIDQHIRDLRLDRRLMRRRDWLPEQERREALDALPDVGEKGEYVKDSDEDSGADGSESERQA